MTESSSAEQDSICLYKEHCTTCGSSDGKAVYSDGHTFCFVCSTHERGTSTSPSTRPSKRMAAGLLHGGEAKALPNRKITESTARKYGYLVAEDEKGTPCQVAPYYNAAGEMVAQKLRGANKQFTVRGELKEALPFGAQAFPKTGKMIVVTEGEIDAMSVSQAFDNKYPVVSIAVGADAPRNALGELMPPTKTKKYFATHADYFNGFDVVVLMFDQDGPGQHSAVGAAEVLGQRAKIATLDLKDANEMLVAGRVADLVNAVYRAKQYRPEGVVEMSTLRDEVLQAPTFGMTTGFPELDASTYGIHFGEILLLTAGTGVGKSAIAMQMSHHVLKTYREKLGLFMLEGTGSNTIKLLVGQEGQKRFHIPAEKAGWTQEELVASFDAVMGMGQVFTYDSFGVNEWPAIKAKMEYLFYTEGVRFFVLDHITAMIGDTDDERRTIDVMMQEMATLAVKLNIAIILISHLNRPKGTPHEEGGRVTLANLHGSGSIAKWSWVIVAAERNQQADAIQERLTTLLRILKMRRDGSVVGNTLSLLYDVQTGRLNPLSETAALNGFGDESTMDTPTTTHTQSEF